MAQQGSVGQSEGDTKLKKEQAQLLVNPQKIIKKQEYDVEEGDQEVLKDQNYVEVLGRNIKEFLKNGSATDGGNKVYSFQNRKCPEKMAKLASELTKQSFYNWLWYETTTYGPYTEETSYENSLLVEQSGALPLSALTHILRSLTPNAQGIFRLLMKYQLDKQEDPSYMGPSFQDFYQQCREAFLVNSDLTLRAQLMEFRDHKLIRTKKGTNGVEYLLIPVDSGTLTDILEKEEEEA
ncbi:Origin recognition complex subunit 2 [Heterocephalus glaber]|uniref:Origin recognition complex subunit 2 n=1 Tax=Heterocephalus glaber TaxID=10181 RepID=G5C2L6_HETGA|nr:Origin recognition complex subunit 2 [Heterocephalus glaber]